MIRINYGKAYTFAMRTTVTLDDASAETAALYAKSRGISLSKAISELILRGAEAKPRIKYVHGLPVFDVPRGRAVTSEGVKSLESDEL
jgi:hypothetical protein